MSLPLYIRNDIGRTLNSNNHYHHHQIRVKWCALLKLFAMSLCSRQLSIYKAIGRYRLGANKSQFLRDTQPILQFSDSDFQISMLHCNESLYSLHSMNMNVGI